MFYYSMKAFGVKGRNIILLKQSIVNMRAEECLHAEINSNKYSKLITQICEVQNRLKELVSPDKRDAFLNEISNLEDIQCLISEIEQDKTYKQGFNDGLEIAVKLLRIQTKNI